MRRWRAGALFAVATAGCGGEVAVQTSGVVGLPDAGFTVPVPVPIPIRLPEAGGFPDVGIVLPPHFDAGQPDVDDFFDAGFDAEGDDDGGFDAGVDTGVFDAGFDASAPDGGWVVADHYPMPTVVDFDGPILSSPVFTAVVFPGYDLEDEAEAFVATVGTTPYWTAAVSQYGVGPAKALPPITLTETAPSLIDDTAIQTWLAGKLDGTNADFGTPTSQSVYVIFYPTGTSVTLMGIQSCVDNGFGGYHNSVALTSGPWSGQNVAYAVVPECAFMTTTAVSLTETTSHELIEATTDPLPLTNDPAYLQTDEADIVWDVVLGGGEIADMCAQNPDAFFTPTGFPYTVQRVWSNDGALAGHDPCQPSPVGQVFFNATAQLDASVTLSYEGQSIPTTGLRIPLHGSQTVEVDLYSDGPIGDWSVSASDLSEDLGGGPYLSFAWDHTTGTNGTKLHLTITPLAAGPYGGQPFAVLSESGAVTNYWLGYVGQE